MSIPIDQDGRIKLQPEDDFWKEINTRIAGGQIEKGYKKQVIIIILFKNKAKQNKKTKQNNQIIKRIKKYIYIYIYNHKYKKI